VTGDGKTINPRFTCINQRLIEIVLTLRLSLSPAQGSGKPLRLPLPELRDTATDSYYRPLQTGAKSTVYKYLTNGKTVFRNLYLSVFIHPQTQAGLVTCF
jgi:hypothetical protein